jgi:hypothetical protein
VQKDLQINVDFGVEEFIKHFTAVLKATCKDYKHKLKRFTLLILFSPRALFLLIINLLCLMSMRGGRFIYSFNRHNAIADRYSFNESTLTGSALIAITVS